MRDSRSEILKQLKGLLDTIGLPVYSVVPDNHPAPFIFIGGIELQQTLNKEQFQTIGTVNIELYTGSNEWLGSLDAPLSYLAAIKQAVQPSRKFVLDLTASGMSMVYWVLFNDTGLFSISSTQKFYNAVIQYEFEIVENEYFNVVAGADNVVFGTENVIHYG